jgi:hypothetical protein
VATDYKPRGCRAETTRQEGLSHPSYEWTREHVIQEVKRVLGELPLRMDLRPTAGRRSRPQLILVHGTWTVNTLYWTKIAPTPSA